MSLDGECFNDTEYLLFAVLIFLSFEVIVL